MEFARERELCRVIVINKIDSRERKTRAACSTEIRETFGRECLPLNLPADGGNAVVDCFFQPRGAPPTSPRSRPRTPQIIDQVVEVDEKLMALYLEQGEELTPRATARLRSSRRCARVTSCRCVSSPPKRAPACTNCSTSSRG